MRIAIAFSVCLLLSAVPALAADAVIRALAGDTIEVQSAQAFQVVHLLGVEAVGEAAKKFTQSRLEAKAVRLENDPNGPDTDSLGRMLRYLYIGDELFNATLLQQGHARVSTEFPCSKTEEFRKLERIARDKDLGIWGQAKRAKEEEARRKAAEEIDRKQKAEEQGKVRAACRQVYDKTADKKVGDLTVREEQQVRACQALGLYPP